MRQLAHELRTPLNAISGFAQMIDQQYLGPAGHSYRERARAILVDAAQLSDTIEGADLSSQLDAGRISRDPLASTDLASIVERIAQEFEPLTERRSVTLRIFLNPGLPRVSIASENCHRMLARLIACLLDYAVEDEVITARATHGPLGVSFSIDRPSQLRGVSDVSLLERGAVQGADNVRQSGLGLEFSLRLVERLAAVTGARLTASAAQLTLILPPAQDSARLVEGG
jgi:signal transduction histidine kinase